MTIEWQPKEIYKISLTGPELSAMVKELDRDDPARLERFRNHFEADAFHRGRSKLTYILQTIVGKKKGNMPFAYATSPATVYFQAKEG